MKPNVKKLIIAALGIVINVVLGSVVSWLSIPLLFLDTIGTIYVSANVGMGYGILTGVSNEPGDGLPPARRQSFALVNVAVAIVVGLMAKKLRRRQAVIAGIILSVVCPLIGTPIRLLLFGGFRVPAPMFSYWRCAPPADICGYVYFDDCREPCR